MSELSMVPAPVAARKVFGERLTVAERYVDLLGGPGVRRGVIGPREAPRLWDRHMLNSVAPESLIPEGARVLDLGSGAGLPGIPLAVLRGDLDMTLVEPMARRVAWLREVTDLLELQVRVVRGRAEDAAVRSSESGVDVVVARAVAPLHRLAGWALPLLRAGGSLVALKGSTVDEEVARDGDAIRAAGGGRPEVVHCRISDGETARVAVVERTVRNGRSERTRKDR